MSALAGFVTVAGSPVCTLTHPSGHRQDSHRHAEMEIQHKIETDRVPDMQMKRNSRNKGSVHTQCN